MTDITIIGLGHMGARIVELMLAAGHSVTVWNRSPRRADGFAGRAAIAADPAAALAASPITLLLLADQVAANDVLAAPGAAAVLAGRIVINLGTIGPDDAVAAQAAIAAHGGRYLDGAIQAAPSQMGRADTPILLAGAIADFDAAEPLLRVLGGGLTHLGEAIDAAAYMDLATLSYVYGAFAGFLHGARIAEARSIDVARFGRIVEAISPSFGAFFAHEAQVIATGDFAITESPMRISLAAIRRIRDASIALGLNAELPALVDDWLGRAERAGLADSELAAVIAVLRQQGPA